MKKSELEHDLFIKINSLISKIDYNIFKLKSLSNIEKKLFNKIKMAMGLKIKSKESLTIQQMESYREYIMACTNKKLDVEANMNSVSLFDELSSLKVELFKDKTNYKKIYWNFMKINKLHERLIKMVSDIIFKGNNVIAVLA